MHFRKGCLLGPGRLLGTDSWGQRAPLPQALVGKPFPASRLLPAPSLSTLSPRCLPATASMLLLAGLKCSPPRPRTQPQANSLHLSPQLAGPPSACPTPACPRHSWCPTPRPHGAPRFLRHGHSHSSLQLTGRPSSLSPASLGPTRTTRHLLGSARGEWLVNI